MIMDISSMLWVIPLLLIVYCVVRFIKAPQKVQKHREALQAELLALIAYPDETARDLYLRYMTEHPSSQVTEHEIYDCLEELVSLQRLTRSPVNDLGCDKGNQVVVYNLPNEFVLRSPSSV
jgi:hypothetical protein